MSSILADLPLLNPKSLINAGACYLEAFLRRPRPASRPVVLDIILTKACNLNCIFCISYKSLTGQHWMPFDLYRRIAGSLFLTAHAVLFCSGGEPFLYRHIRKALRLARENRVITRVTSNGMLIDADTARWIVEEQSLNDLRISLDGARKRTVERLRRGARFERIVQNIARLATLRNQRGMRYPDLRFRFVAMRSNVEELPELCAMAARIGVHRIDVNHLKVCNEMDAAESLYNDPGLARKAFGQARLRAAAEGVMLHLPVDPEKIRLRGPCIQPWEFCQIDVDGAIRPCYHAWRQRLGFFDAGFLEIWRGTHYARLRSTIRSSKPYFPYCEHCPQNGHDGAPAHDQRRFDEDRVIAGLESLRVSHNLRSEENLAAFREIRE